MSWKLSRASAAGLTAAAHVLFIYLFVRGLDTERHAAPAPSVEPIIASLINQPLRPSIPVVSFTLEPKLAKFQVLAPKRTPDFKFEVPAEPTRSTKPTTSVAASPGPRGPTEQAGGPSTVTLVHYVAVTYPSGAARAGKHGDITLALLVDSQGSVGQIKIVRSTGSPRLDESALSAARQWKFAPFKEGTRGEPVWALVRLEFAPPQRLLGVPVDIVPYAAVAREIRVEHATGLAAFLSRPLAEGRLRRLLQKLIAAYPNKRAQDSVANPASAGVSPEAELGLLGSIQTVKFLGFADHGIDRDETSSPRAVREEPIAKIHWEVYDVEQNHGSSVWLIASTPDGSIRHIEVAVRK